MPAAAQPVFFYDLGSPECYLVAERIVGEFAAELAVVPEWEPVLGIELGDDPLAPLDRDGIERRAAALDLQRVRWPAQWPPDTRRAMLAATYAKRIGRAVAFSLAAFRQAFAGGRDLSETDTVLIAGAACEMHPSAVLKAIELRSVDEALAAAAERARAADVRVLPAIALGGVTVCGPDCLERAAGLLAERR